MPYSFFVVSTVALQLYWACKVPFCEETVKNYLNLSVIDDQLKQEDTTEDWKFLMLEYIYDQCYKHDIPFIPELKSKLKNVPEKNRILKKFESSEVNKAISRAAEEVTHFVESQLALES